MAANVNQKPTVHESRTRVRYVEAYQMGVVTIMPIISFGLKWDGFSRCSKTDLAHRTRSWKTTALDCGGGDACCRFKAPVHDDDEVVVGMYLNHAGEADWVWKINGDWKRPASCWLRAKPRTSSRICK